MTIRCLVVEDNDMMRAACEDYVNKTEFLFLAGSCKNGVEAAAILRKEKIDLLLLDIEMPEMSGMELLSNLEEKPMTILITKNKKYAIEAFEQDVIDYIVKPVTYARFLKSVNKASNRLSRKTTSGTPNEIFVRVDSGVEKVDLERVCYIHAYDNYVRFYYEKGMVTFHNTMKNIEDRLDPKKFIRVHRSFMVNVSKVKTIRNNLIQIGNETIPIGRYYRDAVYERLNII